MRSHRRRVGAEPAGSGRHTLLVALGALAVLAALVAAAAHFRSPGRGWVIGVSAFSPYLMLGGPLSVALFLLARRRIGVLIGVLATAVLVSTQAPLYLAADPAGSAHPLVVMTANLRLGNADAAAVVAAVRRDRVDVLMTEELTPDEVRRLVGAGLETLLPDHVFDARPAAGGTGLWSRYPLDGTRRRTDFAFGFVTAHVRVPGVRREPTLIALHMIGPYPDSAAWQQDIAHARTVLRALAGPAVTIAGGDFNSTPDVAQFRSVLAAGYSDAADQAGAGTTRTYPADAWYPPLIAIDHVLTRHAVAISASTVEIPGSDHRALLCTIAVPA